MKTSIRVFFFSSSLFVSSFRSINLLPVNNLTMRLGLFSSFVVVYFEFDRSLTWPTSKLSSSCSSSYFRWSLYIILLDYRQSHSLSLSLSLFIHSRRRPWHVHIWWSSVKTHNDGMVEMCEGENVRRRMKWKKRNEEPEEKRARHSSIERDKSGQQQVHLYIYTYTYTFIFNFVQ